VDVDTQPRGKCTWPSQERRVYAKVRALHRRDHA
jgi:hypothetical protein